MPKRPALTPKQIERMYDSGENRVTQERNDFLLPQILEWVRQEKWINIRPEYQRRLVWDRHKKSLFIESLLMNIPIPPVFLYEYDLGRYEVMDGQQRLNAVLEFYEDNLVLSGLTTWRALNGLTYSECPKRIQRGLDRRRISASVLLAENIKKKADADFIRRTVFERLNTGGQQLNAQELRNAIFPGPFNKLLIELAGDRLFDELWDIPPYATNYRPKEGHISPQLGENKLFRRMIDCEIVLRFIAFRDQSKIRGSVRSILDRCMESNQSADKEQLDEWRRTFHDALVVSHSIFGDRAFRVPNEDDKWIHSQPLFDAVMVAVDSLISSRSRLIRKRAAINSALLKSLRRRSTYEIIVGKPNTANAIKKRISILTRLLKAHSNG